jgi:putative membrane protein
VALGAANRRSASDGKGWCSGTDDHECCRAANVRISGSTGDYDRPVHPCALFLEIPHYHDLALLNEPVHYLMHVTMLLAGLLFWWRVFDRRAPTSASDLDDRDEPSWRQSGRRRAPHGLGYGVRLMMLWLVILSNILLGSYTTLKTTVLYGAYDVLGRLYGYSSLADEQIGGIIIWIPSGMMCLIAVLIVIHLWGLHETRVVQRRVARSTSNSVALVYPATGAALIERARLKNRAMAAGFGVLVFTVFATAILVGVLYIIPGRSGDKIEARDGLVEHASHENRYPAPQ